VGPSRSDPWYQQHYLLKLTDGGWQFGVGSFFLEGEGEGGGLFYMTSVFPIFLCMDWYYDLSILP